MSIANDLNDVIETSGDMLARLAIFADHIPDEGIPPLLPCLKRPLFAAAACLLIWFCGSSWGWPFSVVSPQSRKKNPALSMHWHVRAVTYEVAGKEKTVFTSLPVARFSAAQVATLYHERWEIELGYRDIKNAMQHNAITLRSKKVELVYQELWGGLLSPEPHSPRSERAFPAG